MRLTGPCRVLLASLCLAACQEVPPAPPVVAGPSSPTPMNGVGYLLFNTIIVQKSSDNFVSALDRFHDAGATEIDIAMNSPGGIIGPAQAMAAAMERLHAQGVTFKAYDVGVVASAATFVFLTAQERYSAPGGAFLFHAAGVISNGLLTAQALREQADGIEAYERVLGAALKARTRLSASEVQTYLHRTVLLNSDDARRDGIVDTIGSFAAPKGTWTWVIGAKPGKSAAPKPPG